MSCKSPAPEVKSGAGPQAPARRFCRAIAATFGERRGNGESMALAKRDEGSKVNSDINVTPMVDVMLVLLIIFMVVTPMLQKGVSVDLAKVNNPEQMPDADKEDALVVAVMRTGDVFFGNDKIAPDQLTGKV